MKIVLESSCALKTPPESYGELEQMVYLLAKGLVELNQEVALIATKGSKVPKGCELIETVPEGGSEEEAYKLYKDRLREFEICHTHSWQKFPYMYKMEHPEYKVISTTHSQCPYRSPPPLKFPNMCAVSHAHAMYMASRLKVAVRGVQNGIDLEMFPFQEEKTDRLLFLNRVMAEKGPHLFVDLCRRLRVKGDLCGEDRKLIPDPSYVLRVQRLADGYFCRYWGAISNERKIKFLRNAKAVIGLPVTPYFEVWGLWATEAMACGTPVVTLKSGGLVEQIENGVSGFLCDSMNQMDKIIKGNLLEKISPKDCREQAEGFSYQRMSGEYLKLYQEIVDRDSGW